MVDLHYLEHIAATTKRTEKEGYLKIIKKEYPGFAKFLKWTYDPKLMFYVTVDEDEIMRDFAIIPAFTTSEPWWDHLDDLLLNLSERALTGNVAKEAVHWALTNAPEKSHARWGARIINKDLNAGFSASTINKVWSGLIDEFEVALAKPYDPDKHELSGAWICDGKMDGNRVVIIDGVARSRNGKIYESFPHIVDVLSDLSTRYLIDGEMMASGKFDENSGNLRRKDHIANDAVYNIFDLVPIIEWKTKKFKTSLRDRKRLLESHIDSISNKSIRTIDWFDLTSDPKSEELYRIRDKLMSLGFEGAMLKNLDSVYQPGRSDDLLKLKRFDTVDGRITDVQVHRKQKNMLGAVLVDVDGVISKCGSGFTKQERLDLWETRSSIIGKMIEMECQEKTPDGALRFPTFVKFRPDKD